MFRPHKHFFTREVTNLGLKHQQSLKLRGDNLTRRNECGANGLKDRWLKSFFGSQKKALMMFLGYYL